MLEDAYDEFCITKQTHVEKTVIFIHCVSAMFTLNLVQFVFTLSACKIKAVLIQKCFSIYLFEQIFFFRTSFA